MRRTLMTEFERVNEKSETACYLCRKKYYSSRWEVFRSGDRTYGRACAKCPFCGKSYNIEELGLSYRPEDVAKRFFALMERGIDPTDLTDKEIVSREYWEDHGDRSDE